MVVITKEYWDLGEEPSATNQWPRNNERCLGKIACALVELNGKMLSTHVDDGFTKGKAPITMRIELPYGKREAFETLTGFPLTKPPEVSI